MHSLLSYLPKINSLGWKNELRPSPLCSCEPLLLRVFLLAFSLVVWCLIVDWTGVKRARKSSTAATEKNYIFSKKNLLKIPGMGKEGCRKNDVSH